jgi:hypothetical protein
MNRQDLRNRHPFHHRNPREHVRCCLPRPRPRRPWWHRLLDLFTVGVGHE